MAKLSGRYAAAILGLSVESGKLSENLELSALALTVLRSDQAGDFCEKIIVPALESFIDMGKRYRGEVTAHVVSAAELSVSQLERLGELLSRKLDKNVTIEARIDPDLIGGFYVQVEGRLIDRTVRTQLRNMKENIIKGGAV